MIPAVSVILVNWNTRALTDEAISSLRRFEKSVALEILVVDNASGDGSVEYLEARHPDVRFLRNTANEGFARANNQGVAAATGRHVLLLNTDTVFHEEVLPACLSALKAGSIAGCRLLNADGTLQLSAEPFPTLRHYLREAFSTTAASRERRLKRLRGLVAPVPVDWLTGAFLLMERALYLRLGGLSEEIFMYGEDVEFCWRARRAGARCVYVPEVSIVHLGGGAGDHASLRSLVLSDAGRLKAFALMRGRAAAAALRAVFILRSLLRAKARNHFLEALVLAGAADARRFI